jgi:hypothetical protein
MFQVAYTKCQVVFVPSNWLGGTTNPFIYCLAALGYCQSFFEKSKNIVIAK